MLRESCLSCLYLGCVISFALYTSTIFVILFTQEECHLVPVFCRHDFLSIYMSSPIEPPATLPSVVDSLLSEECRFIFFAYKIDAQSEH